LHDILTVMHKFTHRSSARAHFRSSLFRFLLSD